MEIHNVTQFANFISTNDLVKLDIVLLHTVQCVNTFTAACNCYKAEDKAKIYAACTRMYSEAAKSASIRFKNEFLSKTSDRQITFYTEQGSLIAIMSR